MERPSGTPELGENHRRVLSAVLRGVENACRGIGDWLDRPSGELLRVEDDLTPAQKERLREVIAHLREEIRRLRRELGLERSAQSRRRAILAMLSATIVNLEDTDSTRLAGYGKLTNDTGARIDRELQGPITLLEQMVQVVMGE